jgi:hypothetical protein
MLCHLVLCGLAILDGEDLHIHTSKLTPNLGEDTNVSTVYHTRSKELQISHIGVHAFKVDCLLNFCQFLGDESRIRVTMCVNCDQ